MPHTDGHDEVKGVDHRRVSQWLTTHVQGAEAPFSFEVIAGGHSNLTYRVTDSCGRRMVLRRPPLSHALASAHDMNREHRIISALSRSAGPGRGGAALAGTMPREFTQRLRIQSFRDASVR